MEFCEQLLSEQLFSFFCVCYFRRQQLQVTVTTNKQSATQRTIMGLNKNDLPSLIREFDLDKLSFPDGFVRPQLLDKQWMLAQYERQKYVFNLMSIGEL